jgi:hypothetical protein
MTVSQGNDSLSLDELKTLLKNDNKVKVAGIDVDGVLRGKFMSKEKFLSAVSTDGFGFCSVILSALSFIMFEFASDFLYWILSVGGTSTTKHTLGSCLFPIAETATVIS